LVAAVQSIHVTTKGGDGDLAAPEVQVLDAQAHALEHAQPRPVQERRHEASGAVHLLENERNLASGERL
jgi:hypothetical protein